MIFSDDGIAFPISDANFTFYHLRTILDPDAIFDGSTAIPYKFGKKLFELASEPKTFLQISGDHNYGFLMSGETYLQGLGEFLDSLSSFSEKRQEE